MSKLISLLLPALLLAPAAAALPPPVPVSVLILSRFPPDTPQHRHYAMMPGALAEDGWIEIIESGTGSAEQSACVSGGKPVEACVGPAASGGAPRIVLLVEAQGTIQVRATCLARGTVAEAGERQRATIAYKRLLFAEREARREDRLALAGCLLAAGASVE